MVPELISEADARESNFEIEIELEVPSDFWAPGMLNQPVSWNGHTELHHLAVLQRIVAMYIIVGRRPYQENQVFKTSAATFRQAQKDFVDALWSGEEEERKETEESDGTDHYIEFAVQVKGDFRVLYDPIYGNLTSERWDSSKAWDPAKKE